MSAALHTSRAQNAATLRWRTWIPQCAKDPSRSHQDAPYYLSPYLSDVDAGGMVYIEKAEDHFVESVLLLLGWSCGHTQVVRLCSKCFSH